MENSDDSQPKAEVQSQDEGNQHFFDLVHHWSALSLEEKKESFVRLPRTEAEDLFLSLTPDEQAHLVREISTLEKRSWIRLLAPDDIADLIQELGADSREEILGLLDPQSRREVTALLAYAEDKAGGLMSSRFMRLRPDMSVDEAISYIRIQAKTQVETISYNYVLEPDQTLVGVVSFREIFQAAPHKKIREIMKTDVFKIPVNLDQEEIGKIFSRQDLSALPVVDEWGHMKGIVTFDDIADVIQQENTEDFQKMGAMEALDAPYFATSFFSLLKKRGGWLLLLFFGEMLTATAMGYFQHELERAVVLALFIPLIISSGGNSGSQASTLIIRAMALGEVRLKDWTRVLRRELLMGLSLGALLGTMGALRIIFWPTSLTAYGEHYILIGVAVAASVIGVVLWGTITGSMLPFLLRLLKVDPATASAPFVATLVDVTGLIIYFTVAAVVLSGTLL